MLAFSVHNSVLTQNRKQFAVCGFEYVTTASEGPKTQLFKKVNVFENDTVTGFVYCKQ